MSWRYEDEGGGGNSSNYDPHGGRNAFRMNSDEISASERSMRAMRSFTQSIDDENLGGPPELPASLDIDQIPLGTMSTSDTNDTIIEIRSGTSSRKVDPQLGETQKYKMAVPGPGHSEQEQELHKSLIRDEEDAEVEGLMGAPQGPPGPQGPPEPPSSLNFELRHAYDQKIRKRPTTPTSGCVLDGIAFLAEQEIQERKSEEEKIRVSIPKKKRAENMSEFFEQMHSQIPGQTRRGSVSGRTTPLNDYEGDILDENPNYKNKAPPAPVVHRRSSVEWENFADKMDEAEQREAARSEKEDDVISKNPEVNYDVSRNQEGSEREETQQTVRDAEKQVPSKADKKLAFYAKPPTVEITSPDAPHQGAFHDVKEPKNAPKLVEEAEEEEEEEPQFSEDMDEERRRFSAENPAENAENLAKTVEYSGAQAENGSLAENQESYDPNAYPGYIWNYETQQWDYDPNYVQAQDQAQDQAQAYDYSAYEAQQKAYDEVYGEGAYAVAYGDPQAQAQAYPEAYDQATYEAQQKAYDEVYGEGAYAAAYGAPQAQAQTEDQAAYDYDQAYGEGAYAAALQAQAEAYQAQDQAYVEAQQPVEGQAQAQEYDYSAYGGYEGYLEACRQYDEAQAYQAEPEAQAYQAQEQAYQAEAQAYQAPAPIKPLFEQAPTNDPYAWDAPAQPEPYKPPTPEEPELKPEPELEPKPAPARPGPPARPEAPQANRAPPRPPAASGKSAPPPRPAAAAPKKEKEPKEEEDAWAQFKKMTEKVSDLVKNTESTLKNLEETSAANDIKDESYFAQIGGSQGFVNDATQREIQRLNDEKKAAKAQKKKLKQQGKKGGASPPQDFDAEDAMDRAAQELAIKLASMRTDIGEWKAPEMVEAVPKPVADLKRTDSASAIPPRKKSSIKDVQQDSGGSLELPAHLATSQQDPDPVGDFAPDDPILSAPAWADFETSDPVLPPSESGFFSASNKDSADPFSASAGQRDAEDDPFVVGERNAEKEATTPVADPFAPQQAALIDESYDPFAVVSVEEVVAMAKAKAEQAAANAENDEDFYARQSPALSTPTPEGGSPISQARPNRFEDDFKCPPQGTLDTPTPLYDEDDSQPLGDFIPKFNGDGWDLMVRHPIKKKSFMAERCWKPCFVKLHGQTLYVFNDKKDSSPIQELLLQATYSLSDTTLQAYDVYGKIHTVKLQFVVYKEKVGIRPGQISRLVDGHVTKYGLPLEHSAQCTVLLKFGSLNAADLQSFVTTIEDVLFKCSISRTAKPIYKQDEVQVHCYDEYSAYVDKDGVLSDQKARVRLFCLAFLTGSPVLEVGLNDRRRQGKEIVRRKDILPMYTERWIRFENLDFHSIINQNEFDKEQVISFSPPDGCFFEIMRFRVRPPRNREKAMSVKCVMKIAGSKVEIRIEAMAAAQIQRTRGSDERRQIPCEDIAIRFPIPEAWIYLFREERHWGVGSIHSKKLRPGKVKNLKDRLLGAVQTSEANLIECAIGEAKYEHVYRSLVWRIPRLPEKHHAAYKAHLLKCRFELSSFDLMPEAFLPRCDVEFTMPLATVSNTVVRSVSVEQHEDSDRVEKFVRYVAKYQYKVEIDYVQCANLDLDMADPSVNPEAASAPVPDMHQPTFNHPDQNAENQQGYRIDFNEAEMGGANRPRDDSSSDDEVDSHKMPIIQIDMKNYGY